MTQTFIMCKPDAVERSLVGEIISRIERKGLRIVQMDMRVPDRALAEAHYEEHSDKPFYGELVDFLSRGPVVAMVVEGPDDQTFHLMRTLIGKTQVAEAQPGSIRGDFATTTNENLVHGSDGVESAQREIALWFPN
ncbi:MAG TPA: nucleoside-diphosphate kinase [Microthrixaceae bacterium]|nr:nucleoside-diphosphate kinase [Microthrixaceae bacterium]